MGIARVLCSAVLLMTWAFDAVLSDLQANSPSSNRRFVVYVTDRYFDSLTPTPEQRQERLRICQTLDALTGPNGGGVFISLWEDPMSAQLRSHYALNFTDDPSYPKLAVNGAFDGTSYPNLVPASERFPFGNLRTRILQDP